jgi:hypothetical protein
MAKVGPGLFGARDGEARRGNVGRQTWHSPAIPVVRTGVVQKKGAAIAGGSKSKQGGVKQSGQEPLDVQKMDVLVMVAKA